MKKYILKIFLVGLGMMFFSSAFAQYFTQAPKENERVIGSVTTQIDQKSTYPDNTLAYSVLLSQAKKEYPNKIIDVRNITNSSTTSRVHDIKDAKGKVLASGYWQYNYIYVGKVVEIISPERKLNETLVKAVDKALSRVNGGSRLAIDQVSVSGSELTKNDVNDQLIDVLLENGYKVVAKEYLEKLQEEQEKQQGGGFNERTTAKTENFSGVGYFLNVRVNDKSIRIQVINVSTGEYEGNTTVDF